MLKEEASSISEIKDVLETGDLEGFIASLLNRNRRNPDFDLYLDFWHYEFDQTLTLAQSFGNDLKNKYPYLNLKDVYPLMTKMRLVKDEQEIEEIRKAIHTTNLGILQMMKSAKPGMNEMTLEGIFAFVLAQSLCHNTAFDTIAAGGERATILHYHDNNQPVNGGELFLCDLGATSNYYCADISRTFPISGKFTERQKEIYQIVRNAQKIVENGAKPGVKLKELNQAVINYYKEELPKHGLNEEVTEYYFHSCGHHLGLDTHDIDGGLGAVLKEGNVITNEPGLYISAEGIGIRIEDDLLITADGCEVLSKEIIREADEIEQYMSGH
jgi:Xaa-Pro aminopeptidase